MLTALACALIYLALCAPVRVGIAVQMDGKRRGVHFMIRLWGVSIGLSASGGKKPGKRLLALLKRFAPLIRAALSAFYLERFDLHLRLGLDDAAATALLSGAVRAAADTIRAAAGQVSRSAVWVEADYGAPCFMLYSRCIISLIPGDIMFAVVKAAVKKTQKEGLTWLSIPLRA